MPKFLSYPSSDKKNPYVKTTNFNIIKLHPLNNKEFSKKNSSSKESTKSININIIDSKPSFEINKELLRKDFNSPKNRDKKEWFFQTVEKDLRSTIRALYYDCMRTVKHNIPFFFWYEVIYLDNLNTIYLNNLNTSLKHIPVENNAFVLKTISNTWKISKDKEIESLHPPFEPIKVGKENVKATPITIFEPSSSLARQNIITLVTEQNNFANIHLQTIGKQTDRIEDMLLDMKPPIIHQISTPPFIPHTFAKNINTKPFNLSGQMSDLNEELDKRLKDMSKGKALAINALSDFESQFNISYLHA